MKQYNTCSQHKKAVGDAEIEKMYAFEVWKEKALATLQSKDVKIAEQIAAYVHEIDSLLEINRKFVDKIAELQKEIDEKNKEICDLLDWGNEKDAELDKLEAKIKELQNDFMQVQTNEQLARFKKEELK